MTAPASILLAGGGTAGHVAPMLATAAALRERLPQARLTCLGSPGGLEERLVPDAGYDLRLIPKVPFPRRPDLAAVKFPLAFGRAVSQARSIIDEVGAQIVVGFGGYVCPPAYVAARKRLPLVIHESNAVVGMATKLGMRWTDHVVRAFEVTPLPQAEVIGMPLRRIITQLDRPALRDSARQEFGLRPDLPTLFVTGGSLGAQRINETFEASVQALRSAGVQVLHVTGRGKGFAAPAGEPADPPYVVLEYLDRMDLAYAAADLVVTRSGAGMVSELSAVGLPAVFVPLPIGNGEQRLNTAAVVEAGGAAVVEDSALTPAWVHEHVLPLLKDPQKLAAMSAAAASVGRRDADVRLADLVLRVLDERASRG
ncbi:undecaprenyldiphospho-muramoylpentapeptide beta-N-acetylglucosaminyltransferase [Dermacoccaceae bacterium W4C1]